MTNSEFARRVWITVGITALAVIVLWILKAAFSVLLLVLAGALIAIYFRSLANLLSRKLKLSSTLSLIISIGGTLILIAGFFWFTGNSIQQQVDELRDTLPSAIESTRQRLNESPMGSKIVEKLTSQETRDEIYSVAETFFRSTFGFVGDIYIVIILGIFFTASPGIYISGILKLVPLKSRSEGERVVNKVGITLAKWLKGQLFAMLVVMIMTAIGLFILDVPMALALALIAGILNFIPNFGPLIALIPAALIGFMQGTTTGIVVIALYVTVQVLESSVITPQIQKRLIDIPPALIILAQLLMGVLTGGWGLLLAMPLIAILIVLINELYVKKQEIEI